MASSATTVDVGRPTVRKVLLVDDHEMYLKYWAREFVRAGVAVSSATTKQAALDLARRERPDLAMVDLFLTPPETGIEVIRALKEETPHLFCILVSAHMSVAHAVLAIRAGADDVFFKPFGAKQAIARVEDGVLRRPEERNPSLSQIEWEHIARALHDHGGNISQAAESLGVFRQSLQRKIQKHAPRVITDDPFEYRKLPATAETPAPSPSPSPPLEAEVAPVERAAPRKRKGKGRAKPLKRRRH